MYWPNPTLRLVIVPAIGADTRSRRRCGRPSRAARSLVRTAEDCAAVCARPQAAISPKRKVALGAHEIRLRLLRSLSAPPRIALQPRCRSRRICASRAASAPLERRPRRDEVVVPCNELAGFDGEQRRAAFDEIARPGDQFADAAGEGEKIGVVYPR